MMKRSATRQLPDVRGFVIHGDSIGRTLGYPTANLSTHYFRSHKVATGVYAGWATVLGKQYKAAVVVGVDNKLEVHLLDFNGQIYGQWIRVTLVIRLRDLVTYTSRRALVHRITLDVAAVKRHLATSSQPK